MNDKTFLILYFLSIAALLFFTAYLNSSALVNDEFYYYLAAKSIVSHGWQITQMDGSYFGEPLGKPPLSYYIPTLFYWIGNGNLFIFKLFSPIFAMLTMLLTFIIGRKFISLKTGIAASMIVTAIPLFSKFSVTAYLETLNCFFILLVFYLSYLAVKKRTNSSILLAGAVFGLFIKETSFLIPLFFFCYLILTRFKDLNILLPISLVGLLMESVWMLRNFLNLGNPVYPLFAGFFNYAGLDRLATELFLSTRYPAFNPSVFLNTINPIVIGLLFVGLFVILKKSPIVIGLLFVGLFVILKKSKELDLWMLSFFVVFLLPIVLVPYDIRYIFPEIPVIALISANFLKEVNLYG